MNLRRHNKPNFATPLQLQTKRFQLRGLLISDSLSIATTGCSSRLVNLHCRTSNQALHDKFKTIWNEVFVIEKWTKSKNTVRFRYSWKSQMAVRQQNSAMRAWLLPDESGPFLELSASFTSRIQIEQLLGRSFSQLVLIIWKHFNYLFKSLTVLIKSLNS